MLGEQIAEGRGKRTGRRVLETEPTFKVEVSFEENSKVLGVDGVTIVTYRSWNRPDGSLVGEGEAVFASFEGDTMTWRGIGTGRFGEGGAVSYRGCLIYSTTSAKLARLNTLAGVFEFEVDAEGNTHSKIWAWS